LVNPNQYYLFGLTNPNSIAFVAPHFCGRINFSKTKTTIMSNTLNRFLKMLVLAICLFLAQRSISQETPMGIKRAIETALANNRSLKADSLNISVTEYKNKEIAGLYRPQVNYSSGSEYNPALPSMMVPGSMVGEPSKDLVGVQFGTRYSMNSGIEVKQTIYRKDLAIQIRSAGLQTEIARTKHTLTREELVYQVANLFYSLQTNAEMIRTTQFDYNNMNNILSIAKAQYENGILKRIDYESLEINVANTKSYLNQLQTQYNDQLAHFNYLLGIPASSQTIIDANISQDLRPVENSVDLLQRADLRLSNQMIASKEVELKMIRAEGAPVINSYFRYSYQSQFNKPGKAFDSDYMYNSSTAGISVSISLFDGNRRKNRINGAKKQLEQLQLKKEYQRELAEKELFTANGTLDNYQEQYSITRRNLVLAEKVFNSRKALYTEGVTTLAELLDAESELSKARNHHMQSLIDVQTGRLNVYKANGTLLTEFITSL
jgi:outer membrane protein